MTGWAGVLEANGATPANVRRLVGPAAGVRGLGDSVLQAARALGEGGRRSRHPGRTTRRVSSRRRPRRDGAGGPRGAAVRVPDRARARPRRGILLVRRAGSRRARRVEAGAGPRGRDRVPQPRRRRLPRARCARAGAAGARRCGATRRHTRSLVAMGRAVQPPGHPLRRRPSKTSAPSRRNALRAGTPCPSAVTRGATKRMARDERMAAWRPESSSSGR